jgi:hypothetical protein
MSHDPHTHRGKSAIGWSPAHEHFGDRYQVGRPAPRLPHFDLVSAIIDYENGDASGGEVIALFQHLVNTGMVWQLQGRYGRTAVDLIEAGLVTVPDGLVIA